MKCFKSVRLQIIPVLSNGVYKTGIFGFLKDGLSGLRQYLATESL